MSAQKPIVLITGASGLLGRVLLEEAIKNNYDVIGLAFSRIKDSLIKCDLTKEGEIESLIEEKKPNFIVHAAAERFPDRVENDFERAKALNIKTSQRLASKAKQIGSKLIYISTDYVFDGSSPPYKESDTPNPLNKYGETKYEGEKAILAENTDACILRIPVLYGRVERLEESAITCLLPCLLTEKEKSVSHYEKRYPSHTRDIARIVCGMISCMQKDSSLKGVFQWSGKEQLTKYDMVKVIAEAFGLSHSHISPDPNATPGALRPYDALMDTTRLEDLGIGFHTKFSEGVKECLESWVKDSKAQSSG